MKRTIVVGAICTLLGAAAVAVVEGGGRPRQGRRQTCEDSFSNTGRYAVLHGGPGLELARLA
jgi:hypothetical protein